jgi:non-lysosomal glucosylceramidase
MSQSDSPSDPAINESELDLSRREFLSVGAGAVALSLVDPCCSPADEKKLGTHHIPADKNLDKAWVERLFAKGVRKTYTGDSLKCVGMPIGGIGAGQVYVRGDGTLAYWDIFNIEHNSGYGDISYRSYTPESPVQQGFGLWIKPKDGKAVYHSLDETAFPHVEFTGIYPAARIEYGAPANHAKMVHVNLDVTSPFIPLDAKDSAVPGIIFNFDLLNVTDQEVTVILGGWLQNVVGRRQVGRLRGLGKNEIVRTKDASMLVLSAEERPLDPKEKIADPEVFADFESGTYGDWKKTGSCFGEKPANGTLPGQQPVTGFGGKYLVNTFLEGDKTTGTLTSPEFTIKRPYIYFRIGGGNYPGRTCINLKIGEKVVRTATGKNEEKLEWDFWEVSDLKDKKAVLDGS